MMTQSSLPPTPPGLEEQGEQVGYENGEAWGGGQASEEGLASL